jgi:thioredoxin 2
MSEQLLIRCENCGANNRVPPEKVAQEAKAVCGRCKKPLSFRPTALAVTDATFSEEVERSPLPVLVDMWAPWCGPCRMVTPIVEELAGELAGRMRIAKLNIDDNPATANRFGIESIPALLVFQNGREIDRIVGAQPKQAILHRIQHLIAN